MRRTNKKSLGLVKVLTASAAAVAITSGGVFAYAAEGYDKIKIQGQGIYDIKELSNSYYREQVINAFNNGNAIYAEITGTDKWKEFSASATANDGAGFFNKDAITEPYLY